MLSMDWATFVAALIGAAVLGFGLGLFAAWRKISFYSKRYWDLFSRAEATRLSLCGELDKIEEQLERAKTDRRWSNSFWGIMLPGFKFAQKQRQLADEEAS